MFWGIFLTAFINPGKTRSGASKDTDNRAGRAAIEQLYQEQAAAVYSYMRNRTSQLSDAEDLTSLVFCKALESWSSYRPEQSLVGWLFGIAHHVLADYYRSHARRKSAPLPLDEQPEIELDLPGPEETALRSDEARQIRQAIAELPSLQAEVISLRFIAELSYGEIAQVLGRKEPAVRMLVHRGLENMRQLLAAQQVKEL